MCYNNAQHWGWSSNRPDIAAEFSVVRDTFNIIYLNNKMLLSQSIERILALGGGVTINAKDYLPQQLERFAAFAAQSGAILILRNCKSLLPQSMERIASFSRGKVIFNLDE